VLRRGVDQYAGAFTQGAVGQKAGDRNACQAALIQRIEKALRQSPSPQQPYLN